MRQAVRRIVQCAVVASLLPLAACAELAGLGTPDGLTSLGNLIAIATFRTHELSGVRPVDRQVVVTPRSWSKHYDLPLPKDDPEFMKVYTSRCEPALEKHSKSELYVFAPIAATLLTAWGGWLYDQAGKLVETRIKQFKNDSTKAYDVIYDPYGTEEVSRNVLGSAAFKVKPYSATNCFIVRRAAKTKSGEKLAHGFLAIIKREPARFGPFSRYALVYARLDNAVPITGIADDGSAEPVNVSVTLSVTSGRVLRDRPAVIEVMPDVKFPPLPLAFDAHGVGTPKGCDAPETQKKAKEGGDDDRITDKCEWRTALIPDPAPTAVFYTAQIHVTESGSGVSLAEHAAESFKKLNESTLKKAYTTWLSEAIKRSGVQ